MVLHCHRSVLSSLPWKRNEIIRSRPYEAAAAVAHDKDKPHCTWMLFFKSGLFFLLNSYVDVERHSETYRKKNLLDACELEWTRAIKRDEKKMEWTSGGKKLFKLFFPYPEARLSFFFYRKLSWIFLWCIFLNSGTQYKYLMGFF